MLTSMKTKLICLLALVVTPLVVSAAPPIPAPDANALKWDAESKQRTPKPGEANVAFSFICTNASNYEVSINALHTSCGCTVAQLPSTPYKLEPGSNVVINVSMDVAGKYGRITKTVTVDSTAGSKTLVVSADVPTEKAISETK
jgi:hypothetical protein